MLNENINIFDKKKVFKEIDQDEVKFEDDDVREERKRVFKNTVGTIKNLFSLRNV